MRSFKALSILLFLASTHAYPRIKVFKDGGLWCTGYETAFRSFLVPAKCVTANNTLVYGNGTWDTVSRLQRASDQLFWTRSDDSTTSGGPVQVCARENATHLLAMSDEVHSMSSLLLHLFSVTFFNGSNIVINNPGSDSYLPGALLFSDNPQVNSTACLVGLVIDDEVFLVPGFASDPKFEMVEAEQSSGDLKVHNKLLTSGKFSFRATPTFLKKMENKQPMIITASMVAGFIIGLLFCLIVRKLLQMLREKGAVQAHPV